MLFAAKLKLAAVCTTVALLLGGGAMGGYVAVFGAPATPGSAAQPAATHMANGVTQPGSAVDPRSSWYQANKQWVYSEPMESNSRLLNRAIWIGTFRELRLEGFISGYVVIADPKAVERLHPCEAPGELLIACKKSDFEQRQPQPGETWMIAAWQTDVGTKDGYWSLHSAAAQPER